MDTDSCKTMTNNEWLDYWFVKFDKTEDDVEIIKNKPYDEYEYFNDDSSVNSVYFSFISTSENKEVNYFDLFSFSRFNTFSFY